MGQYKPQILVVDDDKLIVRMLSDILASDFRVLTAGNGEEALAILKKEPIVAILCDQRMPGISGVEVLKTCVEAQPKAVRIMVTATEDVKDVQDAINVGRVHRVLTKPVRDVEIIGTVKGAIREVELEEENRRLVDDLRHAVAELRDREKELERELNLRTTELKEVMDRLINK